jgi:hypothetical protein
VPTVEGREIVSRCRYLQTILLTLILGASPMGASAGGNNPTYGGTIDFGAQLLQLDDGCLALNGTVTSGTFFEDLQRIEIGNRFEYKKRGKVVTEYPESLKTSIRIEGDRCAPALSDSPSSIFQGDSYSVKFQVEWKDGMELRPAVLSPLVAHCTGSTSTPIPRRDFNIPFVTCEMTVDSRGVPLGDHLIVSVFAADGKRLTRLSAGP